MSRIVDWLYRQEFEKCVIRKLVRKTYKKDIDRSLQMGKEYEDTVSHVNA